MSENGFRRGRAGPPLPTAVRRIGAIEVGFRLVRVLEAADGPLALKELSERAGMPASKAHAYVASFVHEGLFVREAATGRYGLGPLAMSLGVAAIRQSDLLELVREAAPELSDRTTCSVILSTWGNRGPAIVYRHDGRRRGPTSIRVGYVAPLWRSATGRAFLAFGSAREIRALLTAEEPQLDPNLVERACGEIRALGYATSDGDAELVGLAAPIFDHDGATSAVLTLSRPYENDTAERRRDLGVVLRDAALAVSYRLGFAPGQQGATSGPNNVFTPNAIYQ